MWLVCGFLSLVFCIIGFMPKAHGSAYWAPACSLAFTALTLLMEYKMVLNWVNLEDWSALMDVVPSMFLFLAGYVIIMLLANAVSIGIARQKR
jgi:hypothetical protein